MIRVFHVFHGQNIRKTVRVDYFVLRQFRQLHSVPYFGDDKMVNLIISFTISVALFRDIACISVKENKPETPLFIPSINYPALVHLHPSGYNTELLENAASFPRYAYNHDSSEHIDPLQRQILFQNTHKRLETIFQNKDNEKQPKESEFREDVYDQLANSILFQEEQKPEFHDLDRRYKRNAISATKVPALPPVRPFIKRENDKPHPFGPYRPTTWTPYINQQESTQHASSQLRLRPSFSNKFKQSVRRERKILDSIGDDSNFEPPNTIRTARPLEMPDFNKEFPDFSFFIPIQTQPLILSNTKSESASSAYSDQLLALVRSALDSKNMEME